MVSTSVLSSQVSFLSHLMVISIQILAFFFVSGLADKLRWYLKNKATFFFFFCYSVVLIFSIVYTEWASVVEILWVCIQEILGSDLGHIIHYSG